MHIMNLGKIFTGATNRPQELDEAARRRLTKRLYIPLPSSGANHDFLHLSSNPFRHNLTNLYLFGHLEARAWIARSLLEKDGLFNLSNEEMDIICNLTDGMNIFPVNHSIST
jgi:SpoVK/Ycf46/Vps4 family AAA+-type ATPase